MDGTYRMRDLCELTGLERQAIHFYMKEGLVPEGKKTGRNTAVYNDEHLSRIRLIKKLQREQFLPLRAIAAVINGKGGDFSPEQRSLLVDVKSKLGPAFDPSPRESVPVSELCQKAGIEQRDLDELVEIGVIGAIRHRSGVRVSAEDAALIELFGELRSAGFTRELGFTPADMALYAGAIDQLFDDERKLLLARLGHLPPESIAEAVDRALPVIGALLSRLHTARARHFFSTLGDAEVSGPGSSSSAASSSSRSSQPRRRTTPRKRPR